MQSEDFVAGVSGWAIYRDGSAEFNNVIVRGELLARAPNGAYVRVYNDATSGRIDLRPPDSAGGVIVPASIISSSTNPESGNPALLITGPTVDGFGGASIYLAAGDAFANSEMFIDADYWWVTAATGVTWTLGGDWEIADNPAGPSHQIFFQVRASDFGCVSGWFDGGGSTSGAVTSAPNVFSGTHFLTDGTVDDDSLRVNFNVLSASYLQSRVQATSATLTLTTYQEISTSSDVLFSKDNVDALTNMIVRMSAGLRSSTAPAVVQMGVRIKTFAGATIGDVDLFRITCSTAAAHTYASGVNFVSGLALPINTFMKARPIWKLITAAGPTITMDANDTLSMEIEEKTV
jgi:hypothetical protein